MRIKTLTQCTIAIGVALSTAACYPQRNVYNGPGCLMYLYSAPNLQGYGLPVRGNTPDLAKAWNNVTTSAKVVYGTWRLFSEPEYNGFMGDYKAPADIPQLVPARALNSAQCISPEPGTPVY